MADVAEGAGRAGGAGVVSFVLVLLQILLVHTFIRLGDREAPHLSNLRTLHHGSITSFASLYYYR